MKTIHAVIFAFVLLLAGACKKNDPEPINCNQTVIFAGKHICTGYLLEKNDGSLLRAVQYGKDNRALDDFFAKSKKGDKLKIGTMPPDLLFDCTVEDSLKYTKVKLVCAQHTSTNNK